MKRSKHLLLGLLLLLCPFLPHAQSLKTFKGILSTPLGLSSGNAVYTYYDDPKTQNRIKHGNFSYREIAKNDLGGSFVREIRGNYKNGWKDGTWTYTLTYKDYYRSDEVYSYGVTGTITLTANYSNHCPNGDWHYRSKYSQRDIWKNYFGQIEHSEYHLVSDMEINLKFSNGVLNGPFHYRNGSNDLTGSFDTHGRMNGLSTFRTSQNEEVTNYKNGLVMSRVNRKNTGEVIEKQVCDPVSAETYFKYNTSPEALKDHGIQLAQRDLFKEKIINLYNTIFSFKDFLYEEIYGERLPILYYENGDVRENNMGGTFFRLNVIPGYEKEHNPLQKQNVNTELETASTEAPFYGTKLFNFFGGSGTEQSLTIKKDGTAIIKSYSDPAVGNLATIDFKGKYRSLMKDSHGSIYKIIDAEKIALLKANGDIETGCREDDNHQCVEVMYNP